MVSVTSDVSSSVPVPAPSKPARSQASQGHDQFGALVDSNTAAADNAQTSAVADPAPRRANASSANSDRPARDTATSDQSAQSKPSNPADNSAPAADATSQDATTAPAKSTDKADAAGAKSADKSTDGKSTDKKGDSAKTDATSTTDGLAAALQAADAAQQSAGQPATPDPVAIAAAPVVQADPNAVGNQAGNSASPLTIAAAGIAASASTAAQIAATPQAKTDTAGATTDKTGTDAATGAKVATDATLGTTADTNVGDQPAASTLAAVDTGTPKTSFKAAATAQSKTDISDIAGGNDAAKTGTPTAAQTATTATAQQHSQTAKLEAADGNALDAKAGSADHAAPATPAVATHDHAAAAQVPPTSDTSAQAASALQAPATNTTSVAGASTATLTATAATTTAVPVSGVPVEIAAAARAGKTRFDISLDPAELGRIDVRIAVDRNGQVTSHLTVEKPETLSMLRQDAPQLQRALDDAGFKTGSNGLSFSLRDQNASGQNSGNGNDNGGNARRLIISDDDALPQAAVGRSYGRMLSASGGVDIRV